MKQSMNAIMKNLITFFAAATLMLAACGISRAEVLTFDVGPDDLADEDTFANGRGGVMFGYDADMPAPVGSDEDGPDGFGTSCFYSDVQGSAAGGTRAYTSIRISLQDLFDVDSVTVSDLTSISYYTKLDSGIDWQIKIYTEDDVADSTWYQSRIEFTRPTTSDGNWHQYTADGLEISKFTVDGVNQSLTGLDTLSDLDSLCGSQKILFVEFIASYASSSPASYSYLDGLSITLDSGSTATINLVPEPSSVVLLLMGIVGAAFYSVRKR